jgi:hypothetical protein
LFVWSTKCTTTKNVVKKNNQGAMKAKKDNGKLVMHEGSPSHIFLTFEVELKKHQKKL